MMRFPLLLVAVLLGQSPAASTPDASTDSAGSYRIIRPADPAPEIMASRKALREEHPPIRGFRVPILHDAGRPWPFDQPDEKAPAELRAASTLVAQTLARDSLLATAAAALRILTPLNTDGDAEEDVDLLQDAGIPVDWLGFFQAPDAPPGDPRGIVRHLRRWIDEGRTDEELRKLASMIPFQFRPSLPGFRVATESGEHQIGTIRLQMTRGTYWSPPGGGDNVDLALQLMQRVPDASFLLTVQQRDLENLTSLLKNWSIDPSRLTLVADQGVISQWAADNGKVGVIDSSSVELPRPALLVPRYASRGEAGSIFITNESFLVEGLAAVGVEVIQSPLLFQGGNILAVRMPTTGERIILLGKAELHRNTAMGLTDEQVLRAFCTELGVTRAVVMPPISFHVDYDVTVRAHGPELVAFVNDPQAAARAILPLGLKAMETRGIVDERTAREARHKLASGDDVGFLNAIAGILQTKLTAGGQFPLSLAEAFSAGPSDSGVANVRLFRLAMDYLASRSIPPEELTGDDLFLTYMQTFHQQQTDRDGLLIVLDRIGCRVVPVPSISDGDHSICYLNGVHDRTRYLMPAYGGLYAPLDQTAQQIFERELGPDVKVIPIFCGESQRRSGAIHCSVSIVPKLN